MRNTGLFCIVRQGKERKERKNTLGLNRVFLGGSGGCLVKYDKNTHTHVILYSRMVIEHSIAIGYKSRIYKYRISSNINRPPNPSIHDQHNKKKNTMHLCVCVCFIWLQARARAHCEASTTKLNACARTRARTPKIKPTCTCGASPPHNAAKSTYMQLWCQWWRTRTPLADDASPAPVHQSTGPCSALKSPLRPRRHPAPVEWTHCHPRWSTCHRQHHLRNIYTHTHIHKQSNTWLATQCD